MTKFKRDNVIGKQHEKFAANILTTYGYKVTFTEDLDTQLKGIDMIVSKGDLSRTVDIKTSDATARTGNLFLETYCSNNKRFEDGRGWFYYSECDFYGFQIGQNELHMINNWALHEYVAAQSYIRNVPAGENGCGFLVNLRDVITYCDTLGDCHRVFFLEENVNE